MQEQPPTQPIKERIKTPFRKAALLVQSYSRHTLEKEWRKKLDLPEKKADSQASSHKPKLHETGEEVKKRMLEHRSELKVQREMTPAKMREQTQTMHEQAKNQKYLAETVRDKSVLLKVNFAIKKAQEFLTKRGWPRRATVSAMVGLALPAFYSVGVQAAGLADVIPPNVSYGMSLALGFGGGLLSGDIISRVLESEFVHKKVENWRFSRLRKKSVISSEDLAPFFKQFNKVISPNYFRSFSPRQENGILSKITMLVYEKAKISNVEPLNSKTGHKIEGEARESIVQLMMEAQIKAWESKSSKWAIIREGISRGSAVVVGTAVLGLPSIIFPKWALAGLVDDALAVSAAPAGQFIRSKFRQARPPSVEVPDNITDLQKWKKAKEIRRRRDEGMIQLNPVI